MNKVCKALIMSIIVKRSFWIMVSNGTGEEDELTDLELTSVNGESDEGMSQTLDFLTKTGTFYLSEKNELEAGKIVISIRDIGKEAVFKGIENTAVDTLRALETMLQYSNRQNTEDTTIKVLLSFGTIGKTAAEQEMETVAKLAASILGRTGNTAVLLQKERETIAVTIALGEIGKAVAKVKYPDISENAAICISCLGEMGKLAAQKNLEEAAVGVELMLEEMAVTAMQENLQNAVGSIVNSIEEIGKSAEDEKMENVILQAASALQTIMSSEGDRFLNDASIAAKIALESLNEFDIINDEANIHKTEEIREMMKTLWIGNEVKVKDKTLVSK
jgi:hypothetical protein